MVYGGTMPNAFAPKVPATGWSWWTVPLGVVLVVAVSVGVASVGAKS